MRTVIAATIATSLAAGCAPSPQAGQPTPEILEVAFRCTNGESLSVRFFPAGERAALVRNGASIDLPQQRSGSGFIYSNGPTTLRGKGRELTVEVGRMLPLHCTSL